MNSYRIVFHPGNVIVDDPPFYTYNEVRDIVHRAFRRDSAYRSAVITETDFYSGKVTRTHISAANMRETEVK